MGWASLGCSEYTPMIRNELGLPSVRTQPPSHPQKVEQPWNRQERAGDGAQGHKTQVFSSPLYLLWNTELRITRPCPPKHLA